MMINRILAFVALLLATLASAPAEARFYSTDPIGYQDQLNLYAYVRNDPVNLTDPTGECSPITCDLRFIQENTPPDFQRAHTIGGLAATATLTGGLGFAALGVEGAGFLALEVAAGDSLGAAGISGIGGTSAIFGKALDDVFGSISKGGDNLLSASLPTSQGNVGVLAEISTNGSTLIMNDLTVFAEEGGVLARGAIQSEMLGARTGLADAAAQRGFSDVQVNFTRVETSSSANPGSRSVTFSTCRATHIEDASGC